MKKYIGLLSIMAMAVTVGNANAQAIETNVTTPLPAVEATAETPIEVEVPEVEEITPKPPLTTAEKLLQAEARLKAQKEGERPQSDVRLRMEAMQSNVELRNAEAEMDAGSKRQEALIQMQNRKEAIKAEIVEDAKVLKEEVKTKRMEAKEMMQTLRTKIKNQIDEVEAKVLEARVKGREMVLEKLDLTVERTENQKLRLESQADKLKLKGIDVAKTLALSTEAGAKIQGAKDIIAEAHIILAGSLEELTKEDKTTLQDLIKKSQRLVKEANAKLIEAGKALREALGRNQTAVK